MKPALAQVSTLNAPFELDVSDYSAAKCHALEVWFGKLETYLASHSVHDVRRLLDRHGMIAPVASYQGGLLQGRADAQQEHGDHFGRRLQTCRQLDIGTIVLAADLAARLTQQDFQSLTDRLAAVAKLAAGCGVRIALEFQAKATFVNNLQTAIAVVQQIGNPHLGICLDAFHFFTGPSKTEDLQQLTQEILFHVQLCDVADRPRELAADADRILPGDGDLPLDPIVEHLKRIRYSGHVSVELMNPRIWQIPPRSFAEIAMTALRKTLGQASMDGPKPQG